MKINYLQPGARGQWIMEESEFMLPTRALIYTTWVSSMYVSDNVLQRCTHKEFSHFVGIKGCSGANALLRYIAGLVPRLVWRIWIHEGGWLQNCALKGAVVRLISRKSREARSHMKTLAACLKIVDRACILQKWGGGIWSSRLTAFYQKPWYYSTIIVISTVDRMTAFARISNCLKDLLEGRDCRREEIISVFWVIWSYKVNKPRSECHGQRIETQA